MPGVVRPTGRLTDEQRVCDSGKVGDRHDSNAIAAGSRTTHWRGKSVTMCIRNLAGFKAIGILHNGDRQGEHRELRAARIL